ncbi:MAG TPA: DUF2007 domain-containing protein [Ignavibacteriales bacterium]|nr:DUF2007 domain-containing protein [Ignavibacteriales bacterium]HOL82166.1 DUF2007 domain-containing protein [Ignavibacteriales bacterium]HOM65746.1 DUF2007 domain-containing protein [Ignavibacteriales bacterium]HPD67601.1 DUF2007 domain-containing protein [Ignavibacteriales bacterium]HPP34294.1 DUF2007 domain-containing protein [Ignavibacteriales bacterium]
MSNNISNEYVLVWTLTNSLEAELIKSMLESANIDTIIYNTQDSFIPSIGEIKIFVKLEQFNDATFLINEFYNKKGFENNDEI